MLTRREFNKTMSGLMAASLLAGRSSASPSTQADIHLNRLTFGATPETRETFETIGPEAWLEEQLSLSSSDPSLGQRLSRVRLWIEYEAGQDEEGRKWSEMAEARPLSFTEAEPDDIAHLLDWNRPMGYPERRRPGDEVAAVAMLRAVHGKAQLREVMTQFWHDHFSVNITKDHIVSATFAPYDQFLRTHALGNFREMLGGVARSPAMLRYLNNDDSRASPANENYARELLELHTLGIGAYFNNRYERWSDVPGAEDGLAVGYIDDDVYEAARAFSGWSIGDQGYIAENENRPLTGDFFYVDAWHDPYQKRVLGKELPSHAAPMADGETVLDLLADHPETARFVTGKILARLGIENPSERYRERVAKTFREAGESPDQIARTLIAIVHDPEFENTPPSKLRRPFEFAAAYLRATEADVSPRSGTANWYLARAGWTQHQVRPPTGHSDATEDWSTTQSIAGLVNIALHITEEWMDLTERPLIDAPGKTMEAMTRHWENRFGLARDKLHPVMEAMGLAADDLVPEEEGSRAWINTSFTAAASLNPEFLFR